MFAIVLICFSSTVLNLFLSGGIIKAIVVNAQSCSSNNDCLSANTYKYDFVFNNASCMCVCLPGWTGDRCQNSKPVLRVNITSLNYESEYWSTCGYAKNYYNSVETCRAFGNNWDIATVPTEDSAKKITILSDSVFGSTSNRGSIIGGETEDYNVWKWNYGRIKGSIFFIKNPNRQCFNNLYCSWAANTPDNRICDGSGGQNSLLIARSLFDDVHRYPFTCTSAFPYDYNWFPDCFVCERSKCNIPLDCGNSTNFANASGYYPNCTCNCKPNWHGKKCDNLTCVINNCVANNTYKFAPTIDGKGCMCVCLPGWTGSRCQNHSDIPSITIVNRNYTSEYWSTCRYATSYQISIQTCRAFGNGWDMATAPTLASINVIKDHTNSIFGSGNNRGTWVGGETIDENTWKWQYVRVKNETFFDKGSKSCLNGFVCPWAPGTPDNMQCNNSGSQTVVRILNGSSFDDIFTKSITCVDKNLYNFQPDCFACERSKCTLSLDCDPNITGNVTGYFPNCTCKNRFCMITKDCSPNSTSNVSGIYPICTCACMQGYLGHRCEKRYCDISKDCNLNATSNVSGIYPNCTCQCKPGWTGDGCSNAASESTLPCSPASDLDKLLSRLFVGALTILSILLGATETIAQLQGLVALGHFTCSRLYYDKAFGSYHSLSPFAFADSFFGVVLGNVAVIVAVGFIQAIIVFLMRFCYRTRPWEEFMSKVYFPAFVIQCTFALSCGTTFAASQLAINHDQPLFERIFGIVVLGCAVAYPIGVTIYAYKYITRAYFLFSVTEWLIKKSKFGFWKWIAPQGIIFSAEVRNSYGALITYRQSHYIWPSYQMWTPALFGLFGLINPSSSTGCAILMFILVVQLAAIVILSIIFCPICSTAGNILNIVTRVLLTIAVLLAAIAILLKLCVGIPLAWIGYIMVLVIFVRMIQSCFELFYRMRMLNEGVPLIVLWEHNTTKLKKWMQLGDRVRIMLDNNELNNVKDANNKDHEDEVSDDSDSVNTSDSLHKDSANLVSDEGTESDASLQMSVLSRSISRVLNQNDFGFDSREKTALKNSNNESDEDDSNLSPRSGDISDNSEKSNTEKEL